MTDYVFPPAPTASVAVINNEARFPVRRIFCVGRNYAAHAREMGRDHDREPPFFFSYPADAMVADKTVVSFPPETEYFQYEGEMVVAIGKGGRNITQAEALSHVWGYGIGNELTRRDLQLVAKEMGRPWDWGKAFDNSAICGPIHQVAQVGHPSKGSIKTSVNGVVKQDADLAELIWSIPEVISILSQSMEIKPGDLIYSGTPAGVGKLEIGDVCTVEVEGLGVLTTTIGPKAV